MRITNGLWGMFIADSLSMPVHWYYNRENIYNDFGLNGITNYEDARYLQNMFSYIPSKTYIYL